MYRLGLNQAKSNNYMFFDFEAPLCLSVDRNTGVVERLTPSILSALKSKTLVLLEGELPAEGTIKTDMVKSEDKIVLTAENEETVSTVVLTPEALSVEIEEKAEEEVIEEEVIEEVVEKKPATKRGPKKTKAE